MDEFASLASILSLLTSMFFLDPKLEGKATGLIILLVLMVFFNSMFILFWAIRLAMVLFTKINRLVVDRAEKNILRRI